MKQYAYLLFARDNFKKVTVDGIEEKFPRSVDDNGALKSFYEEHIEDDLVAKQKAWDAELRKVVDSAQKSWDSDYRSFKDQVSHEPFVAKVGPLGSRVRVSMVRLTLPSDKEVECEASDLDDVLMARFVQSKGPRPDEDSLKAEFLKKKGGRPLATFQDWKPGKQVTSHRGWFGSVVHPDGLIERLPISIDSWPHGAPLAEIIVSLNELTTKGWTVVSAAEDKGLYRGVDVEDEAAPARMRFLLERNEEGADA